MKSCLSSFKALLSLTTWCRIVSYRQHPCGYAITTCLHLKWLHCLIISWLQFASFVWLLTSNVNREACRKCCKLLPLLVLPRSPAKEYAIPGISGISSLVACNCSTSSFPQPAHMQLHSTPSQVCTQLCDSAECPQPACTRCSIPLHWIVFTNLLAHLQIIQDVQLPAGSTGHPNLHTFLWLCTTPSPVYKVHSCDFTAKPFQTICTLMVWCKNLSADRTHLLQHLPPPRPTA